MMRDYVELFGFEAPPFSLSPDPSVFFPSREHVAALEALRYGMERGEGFMVLTGEAGTGKSLILRLLLEGLGEEYLTAVLLTPRLDPAGLMVMLCEDLGLSVGETPDVSRTTRIFRDHLLKLAGQGRRLLVVVDEAQNLPVKTLEQLRLLSNFETGQGKLLQILLAGQEGLMDLISSPELGQLMQRITVCEGLRPLSRSECERYISFRLTRAGRGDITCSKAALFRIHRHTRGIPRLVNRLMDRTLLVMAARGLDRITWRAVSEAISTMDSPGIRSRFLRLGAGVALLASIVFLFFTQMGVGPSVFERPLVDEASMATFEGKKAMCSMDAGDDGPWVQVSVARALVRTRPDRRYPQITTVTKGERYRLLGRMDGWCAIEVHEASGETTKGWIRQDLVQVIQDPVSVAESLERGGRG